MDFVDILLRLGIFLTFVVFAVAVFCIKRDLVKKRREQEKQDEVD